MDFQDPTIKVTRIGKRWHARLFHPDGRIIDEMACVLRDDIGWICREMLRWYDKAGWLPLSRHAMSARRRHNTPRNGQVWYRNQLLP